MEKNIVPYKQKGSTCAIACMLMVLEYYKIIPKASYIYEKKYYNSYHSNYMEGTPFSALAWHFAKNGLDTEIIHSEKNIFKNSDFIPNEVFENAMDEYKSFLTIANNMGAKIINGVDVDCNVLKQKLDEYKLIILAGQIDNYLHAILLCEYSDNTFIVCDPLYKQKLNKTYDEIENFMNTSIGKWFIAVKNK